MSCPNCGCETNEPVCPVCGTQLAEPQNVTGGGMSLKTEMPQGSGVYAGDQTAQGMDPFMGNQMNNDMGAPYGEPTPYVSQPPKKSGVGAALGIIIALVLVAVAAVIFVVLPMTGKKGAKQAIEKYMDGIAEGDTNKITEIIDPDSINGEDLEELATAFESLKAMGIEYTVTYDIKSGRKAKSPEIKSMCDMVYSDEAVSKDVKGAWIFDVEYTMEVSALGETQTETDSFYLISYKKDGKWYVGGTMEEQ